MHRLITLLCAALLTSAGLADDARVMPVPFVANYQVTKGNVSTKVVFSLRRDGRWWRFESRSEPSGMLSLFSGAHVREISILLEHEQVLRPAAYNYMAGSEPSKRDVASYFDWQRGQLLSTRGKKPLDVPLPEDTVDRLAVLLEMGRRLRAGEREVVLPVADKGKIRDRNYSLLGSETLKLSFGTVETLRVKELREPGKRYTESWFAVDHGYLPVKIDQYRKGKLQGSFVLQSIEWQ